MKNIFIFIIVVVNVLFISGCSKESNLNEEGIKPGFESFKDSLYTNYKAEVTKRNKVFLNILFDNIAYKSIDLVLKDRAYKSKPEEAPELRGVGLNQMKSKITGASENDSAIRKYIDKFITVKHGFSNKELSKKTLFVDETNKIIKSEVYLQNILKDKAEDSLYEDLNKQIIKLIKITQGKYIVTNSKTEWLKDQGIGLKKKFKIQQEKKKESTQDFNSILKGKNLLFFSLLIASLLLNLILGTLWYKSRKKNKKSKVRAKHLVHKKEQQTVQISPLSSSEVSSYVSQSFKKAQVNLAAEYHRDCLETEIQNFQSYKADVSKRSIKNQFKNQRELIAFVSALTSKYEALIAQKLENIIDKQSAQRQLEQQLDTENFALKYTSSLVSEEELRSRLATLKTNFYDDIPKVISKNDLELETQNLREILTSTIEKIIAENSQLYFPYADAHGVLYDDKKSKEKERESAIKVILNPKENTRATFQLLYDYSDMMLAGIQSYDILLLPICDLKSDDFDRNGNKISQNGEDGQMILENGQWKVSKKLSIKIT